MAKFGISTNHEPGNPTTARLLAASGRFTKALEPALKGGTFTRHETRPGHTTRTGTERRFPSPGT